MQRYEAVETFPLIPVLLLRRLSQAVGIPTRWYRLPPRTSYITLRSSNFGISLLPSLVIHVDFVCHPPQVLVGL